MTNIQVINQITSWAEPYHMDYLENLKSINQIVTDNQFYLPANIFYHATSELDDHPDATLRDCRRSFALFAHSCDVIVEQGFNAGHNAMLALTVNDQLSYISTDAITNTVSRACYHYLKNSFGLRLEYHIGPDATDKLILPDKKTGFVIEGSYNECMVKHTETVKRLGRSGDLVMFNNLYTPEQAYVVCWAQMQMNLVPMFYNADKQMVFFLR